MILFWSVLDPGNKEKELNFSAGDLRGYVATGLLLLYQILVVILLLNLLIALMNSTVQKVEDQKLLYWKFVRTSIWYEFFDDQGGVPIPFSIINVFWYLYRGFIHLLRKFCKVNLPFKKKDIEESSAENPSPNAETRHQICEFGPSQWKYRIVHAKLMMELIQRYNEQFQNARDDFSEFFKKHNSLAEENPK